MQIDQWLTIIQTIILTLGLVVAAIELNKIRNIMRANSVRETVNCFNLIDHAMMEDPSLNTLFDEDEDNFDLSQKHSDDPNLKALRVKLLNFMYTILNQLEVIYSMHRYRVIDEQVWGSYLRWVKNKITNKNNIGKYLIATARTTLRYFSKGFAHFIWIEILKCDESEILSCFLSEANSADQQSSIRPRTD